MMYDVIVIGGGASGLMAAGRAAERGKKVLLLEKNKRLGEKLRITGGGRCNVTNATFDEKELLKVYGDAEPFLYSPFSQFGVERTFSFFENRGLPLVTQSHSRVFPETEKAFDVYNVLERFIQKGQVKVAYNAPVTNIETEGSVITSVMANGTIYRAKSYILATGGVSHPETGSTGEGFTWLKELGHTVKEPTPDIVPLMAEEEWIQSLAGKTLPNIKITFFVDKKKAFVEKGDILCTHFGLSGPTILNSARRVKDLLHDGDVTAEIDLFPQTDMGVLDKEWVAFFESHKNKNLKNTMKKILPPGTGESILKEILDEEMHDIKVHSLPKETRRQMAHAVKALPVTITSLMGFDRAVIADGGVPLSEIDTKTMQSLKKENLYITGDLLHVNRPSGGYSLQLCWTTGFVAGTHA